MSSIAERLASLESGQKHLKEERDRSAALVRELVLQQHESIERIITGNNQSIERLVTGLGHEMSQSVKTSTDQMKIETDRWLGAFRSFIRSVLAAIGACVALLIGGLGGGATAVKAIIEALK